jgi:hypothetical protein
MGTASMMLQGKSSALTHPQRLTEDVFLLLHGSPQMVPDVYAKAMSLAKKMRGLKQKKRKFKKPYRDLPKVIRRLQILTMSTIVLRAT